MNDSSYGNIRQEQIWSPQSQPDDRCRLRPISTSLRSPARAACDGVRVDTEAALGAAVRTALASQRPWVIDVRLDRDPSVWTFPPFLAHEPEA